MMIVMMMSMMALMMIVELIWERTVTLYLFFYCSSVLWWPGPSWSVLPSCPCFSSFKWYECMREKYFILFGKHWFMVTVSIIDLLKPDIKEIKMKNAWHIEDHVRSDSSILTPFIEFKPFTVSLSISSRSYHCSATEQTLLLFCHN